MFGDLCSELGCIFAAIKMHTILLNGILSAPNSFFDQTPIGRILSRFSQDIESVDDDLPALLESIVYATGEVILCDLHYVKDFFDEQCGNDKELQLIFTI